MQLFAQVMEETLPLYFHPISELLKGVCLQSHGFQPMGKPPHYYQLLKGVCLQSHGFQPMGKPQHHYRAEGTEETAIAQK
jgi:hypothetical protein